MRKRGERDKSAPNLHVRAAGVLLVAAAFTVPLVTNVSAAILEREPVIGSALSSAFECTSRPSVAAPSSAGLSAGSAVTDGLCGAGKVAQPRGVIGSKGHPPRPPDPTAAPAPASARSATATGDARGTCEAKPAGPVQFHYAGAYEYVVSAGTRAYLTQPQPCLAGSDAHSLVELAVQSQDGRQIVEVGWTVDRALNGDALSHLFVYHWVDGQATCYNGCGFVQYSTSVRPGMAVAVTSSQQEYAIRSFDSKWWISYQSQWVGYFPQSLWDGAFTSTGLVQWFGEVAATTDQPCTDMGNGLGGTSSGAALVNNISYFGGPTTAAITTRPSSAYYSPGQATSNAFRFGGAGAC